MTLTVAESTAALDKMLVELTADCLGKINQTRAVSGDEVQCPVVWDGIICWPATPAGLLQSQVCPSYIVGFNSSENATKLCEADGTWYSNPERNQMWTNYSLCYSTRLAKHPFGFEPYFNTTYIKEYFPTMMIISQVGYGLSLATLLVAFCILASFKRLRCPRNSLHMHLFVSFIMRAFIKFLKDMLFSQGVGLSSDIVLRNDEIFFNVENNLGCKAIMSLWQYFIMANYSWILMEGLYLHNLIFLALFSDTSAITLYVILGWGFPALFVVPWTVLRLLVDDELCWTTNIGSKSFLLLIRLPIVVSIVLNFALFVNIVRVLLLKLRSSLCKETRAFRRWAKSTLVLVPLFGVHYTVFLGLSYTEEQNPEVEITWLFCDQLFASFQGFFVAVLYCFMNGEVRAELRRLECAAMPSGKRWYCKPQTRALCYSSTSCTSLSGTAVRRWDQSSAGPSLKKLQTPLSTEPPRPSCCSYVSDGLLENVELRPFTGH